MHNVKYHWFYGARHPSPYAVAEQFQQDMWWRGLYETHVTCTQTELPYLLRGYWKGHPFEVEFEPGQSLILRADAELEWLVETLTRSLRRGPAFRYQDEEDRYVFEWWVKGREERWQAMQGQAAFKHLEQSIEK